MAKQSEAARRRAFDWNAPVPPRPDFLLQVEGSISLLHPVTEAAHDWIVQHIPEDAQFLGDAVAIEWRYVGDIVFGAQNDGLVVVRS